MLRDGTGPIVWFRADMDANAVRETTGLSYAAAGKQRLPDGSEVDFMNPAPGIVTQERVSVQFEPIGA